MSETSLAHSTDTSNTTSQKNNVDTYKKYLEILAEHDSHKKQLSTYCRLCIHACAIFIQKKMQAKELAINFLKMFDIQDINTVIREVNSVVANKKLEAKPFTNSFNVLPDVTCADKKSDVAELTN